MSHSTNSADPIDLQILQTQLALEQQHAGDRIAPPTGGPTYYHPAQPAGPSTSTGLYEGTPLHLQNQQFMPHQAVPHPHSKQQPYYATRHQLQHNTFSTSVHPELMALTTPQQTPFMRQEHYFTGEQGSDAMEFKVQPTFEALPEPVGISGIFNPRDVAVAAGQNSSLAPAAFGDSPTLSYTPISPPGEMVYIPVADQLSLLNASSSGGSPSAASTASIGNLPVLQSQRSPQLPAFSFSGPNVAYMPPGWSPAGQPMSFGSAEQAYQHQQHQHQQEQQHQSQQSFITHHDQQQPSQHQQQPDHMILSQPSPLPLAPGPSRASHPPPNFLPQHSYHPYQPYRPGGPASSYRRSGSTGSSATASPVASPHPLRFFERARSRSPPAGATTAPSSTAHAQPAAGTSSSSTTTSSSPLSSSTAPVTALPHASTHAAAVTTPVAPERRDRTDLEILHSPLNLPHDAVREVCECSQCGRAVAALVLHGDRVAVSRPHECVVVCAGCCVESGAGAGGAIGGRGGLGGGEGSGSAEDGERPVWTLQGQRLKKRNRKVVDFGPAMVMLCEGCGCGLGRGGVRLLEGKGGGVADGEGGKWNEPDFLVESLCVSCVRDFDFCSNCGGGGTWRSGKWRPRQMFKPGRRTCSLSHLRLGNTTPVQVTTISTPPRRSQLPHFRPAPQLNLDFGVDLGHSPHFPDRPHVPDPERTLRGLAEEMVNVARELLKMQRCTPAVMRETPFFSAWAHMERLEELAKAEIERLLLGDDDGGDGGDTQAHGEGRASDFRRYVGIAHIAKPSSLRKSRRKNSEDAGGAGVAGPSQGGAMPPAARRRWSPPPGHHHHQPPSTPPSDAKLQMVGFASVEWDIASRTARVTHGMSMGHASAAEGTVDHRIVTSLFSRLAREAREIGVPCPEVIWTLVRKGRPMHAGTGMDAPLMGIETVTGAGAAKSLEGVLNRCGLEELGSYCEKEGVDLDAMRARMKVTCTHRDFYEEHFLRFATNFKDRIWK
ncbi:hypothetical protein HK101_003287 [Irineochytrium annulatum]|nr:hypothetical protein HK101_003287 [Irineochytrium annulatum]